MERIDTTLAALELDYPRGRYLSVPDRRLIPLRDGEAAMGVTNFYFILDYPLADEPLNKFVNAVAPYKNNPSSDAYLDMGMPDSARIEPFSKSGEETENARLYRLHSQDPVIAKAFKQFVGESLPIWRSALGYYPTTPPTPLSYGLAELRLLNKEIFSKLSLARCREALTQGQAAQVSRIAKDCSHELDFQDFLLGTDLGEGLNDSAWGINNLRSRFGALPPGEQTDLMQRYIEVLSPESQLEFGFNFGFYRTHNNLLVDPQAKVVYQTNIGYNVDFMGNYHLKISVKGESSSTTIAYAPQTDENGFYDWGVVEFNWPPAYLDSYRKRSILPVLAYQKDREGSRTPLGQRGLTRKLRRVTGEIDGKPEIVSGRILLAGISREVMSRERWARETHGRLRGGRRIVEMGALQTLGWVSVPKHFQTLLADDNPAIQKLEGVFAT